MSKSDVPLIHGSISWLTLFYDLIIVAVFARATYIYGKNPSWETLGFIGIALLSLYVMWSVTTLELLLAEKETWARRGVVFVQVCALLVTGLAMYRGGGISDRFGFIALTVAFLSLATLTQLRRQDPQSDHRFIRPLTVVSLVTAAIFAAGACFPMGFAINGFLIAWAFYGVGTLVAAIGYAAWAPRLIVAPSYVQSHLLNERFGVLLLIALGDAFVKVLEVLGAMRSIPQPQFLGLTILFVVGVWLLYYPTLSNPALPRTLAEARSRIAAHFLLVVMGGVGIIAYVELATGFGEENHQTQWTSLPVLGVMVSILWLTLLNDRKWTKKAWVLFTSCIALVILTLLAEYADTVSREIDLVISNFVTLITAIILLEFHGKLRRATPPSQQL